MASVRRRREPRSSPSATSRRSSIKSGRDLRAGYLPHRMGPEISQPQRILRASRGRSPGERPRAAKHCAGPRCSALAQRHPRGVVSRSACTRRRTRARVGRHEHAVRARRGGPTARLVGPPGELLLYLFGRRAAAQIDFTGDTRCSRRRSRGIVRHVSHPESWEAASGEHRDSVGEEFGLAAPVARGQRDDDAFGSNCLPGIEVLRHRRWGTGDERVGDRCRGQCRTCRRGRSSGA